MLLVLVLLFGYRGVGGNVVAMWCCLLSLSLVSWRWYHWRWCGVGSGVGGGGCGVGSGNNDVGDDGADGGAAAISAVFSTF